MAMKVEAGTLGWQQRHVALYLKTDGAEGDVVDFGRPGMNEVPCLLLQTTGRKSKTAQTTPLIYGKDGTGFVIIASKGGAPEHPAWYLNLSDNAEVRFQVANKKYRGVARTVASPDRERLYAMMTGIFPPYRDYQEKTTRKIPVVVLEPKEEIAAL